MLSSRTSFTHAGESSRGGESSSGGGSVRYRWRVVDIVVASVVAVATGLIFFVWNGVGYAWYAALESATPGIGGLAVGIWLIGGVVGGLIIRKPGAAVYVELLAALVSTLLVNQWGISTLYSGLAQGIGAEIIFAVVAYRRWGIGVSMAAGAGAAVGAYVLELFISGNMAKSWVFNVTYLATLVVSGLFLAGLLGFFLVRALAATGALDRFAVGRERHGLV